MCIGCELKTPEGESTTETYLDWQGEYNDIVQRMKALEKAVLGHAELCDKKGFIALRKHHKGLQRARKQFAKQQQHLNK